MDGKTIAVVVIGRNEGERLKYCLRSIPDNIPAVYVDSGSTDGSVAYARSIGVTVLELEMSIGFTAARARNVGWRHVVSDHSYNAKFIQFIDGDCELDKAWLDKATQEIHDDPKLAVVFGRRRERFPARSIYNRICDDEWNVPIGLVASCGGDALFLVAALQSVGGYCDDLIAGEEPDLCLRLGRLGWYVRRVDAEMTLHDANIIYFKSWWRRAKRGGFAYAAHALKHGDRSNPQWLHQLRSIMVWGFIWPIGGLIFATFWGFWNPLGGIALMAAILGSYAAQVLRIAARKHSSGSTRRFAIQYSLLMMIGKFAAFSGIILCWVSRLLNRRVKLIEYKQST